MQKIDVHRCEIFYLSSQGGQLPLFSRTRLCRALVQVSCSDAVPGRCTLPRVRRAGAGWGHHTPRRVSQDTGRRDQSWDGLLRGKPHPRGGEEALTGSDSPGLCHSRRGHTLSWSVAVRIPPGAHGAEAPTVPRPFYRGVNRVSNRQRNLPRSTPISASRPQLFAANEDTSQRDSALRWTERTLGGRERPVGAPRSPLTPGGHLPQDPKEKAALSPALIRCSLSSCNLQQPVPELKGPFSVSRSEKQHTLKNQVGARFCSLNKYFDSGPSRFFRQNSESPVCSPVALSPWNFEVPARRPHLDRGWGLALSGRHTHAFSPTSRVSGNRLWIC